jgi:hypothetical protein
MFEAVGLHTCQLIVLAADGLALNSMPPVDPQPATPDSLAELYPGSTMFVVARPVTVTVVSLEQVLAFCVAPVTATVMLAMFVPILDWTNAVVATLVLLSVEVCVVAIDVFGRMTGASQVN